MARRFEEQMVTIAMEGDPSATLEGIFVPGGGEGKAVRGAVVAPPHPLHGGSMDSPVVNEIAWACARSGIASLRFNWRGVGASAGTASDAPEDGDSDYRDALAQMTETVPGPVVACGYSFGAAAALRVARASTRVDRLVLVAPPPSLLGKEGFAGVKQRLLVLVGDADQFVGPEKLAEALGQIPGATFEAITGADHFFGAGLATVGHRTLEWLGARAGNARSG
jgi:alpha/beta superfamily hydrolase